MKLKRYVLLDNDRIVDLNDWKHLNLRVKDNGLHNSENYKFVPFGNGKIIATSDDVTDLIRKNDLVKYEDFNIVLTVEEIEDIGHNWIVSKTRILLKNRIVAIFKLIDNDYICVWEKEVK